MNVEVPAVVAVVLLGVLAVFQIALALGAPWGSAAWGGRNPGVLPTRLRIASGIVGLFIYPLVAVLVLSSSGLIGDVAGAGSTTMWFLTGLFGLGALANFASRSKVERVWGPVALALAICCALIARAI